MSVSVYQIDGTSHFTPLLPLHSKWRGRAIRRWLPAVGMCLAGSFARRGQRPSPKFGEGVGGEVERVVSKLTTNLGCPLACLSLPKFAFPAIL